MLIPDTIEEKLWLAIGAILGLLLFAGFSLHGESIFTVCGTIGGAIVGGVIAHKSTANLYTMQKKDKEEEIKRNFIKELNMFINKESFQQLNSKGYYVDYDEALVGDLYKHRQELVEIFLNCHNYSQNVELFRDVLEMFDTFIEETVELSKHRETLSKFDDSYVCMKRYEDEDAQKVKTLFTEFLEALQHIPQKMK